MSSIMTRMLNSSCARSTTLLGKLMNRNPMSMFIGLRNSLNMELTTLTHYLPHRVLQEHEQDARPSAFALPEILLEMQELKVAIIQRVAEIGSSSILSGSVDEVLAALRREIDGPDDVQGV